MGCMFSTCLGTSRDCGFHTVPDGERLQVTKRSGRVEVKAHSKRTLLVFHGPTRLFAGMGSRVRPVPIYNATEREYLRVRDLHTGAAVHHAGPVTMFFDPLRHHSVEVHDAITLQSHECLVVFRRRRDTDDIDAHLGAASAGASHPSTTPTSDEAADTDDELLAVQTKKREAKSDTPLKTKKKKKMAKVVVSGDDETVIREVIRGPKIHVPASDEWIHTFSWHGTDRNNKTKKTPNGIQFQKLRCVPDQFYYNISDVRTSDDALITVKLMIFFELVDLERMLDTTHDPIGDMINGATADVVSLVARMSYETFLESSAQFNNLDTYKVLTSNAKRIGYVVSNVVYRGYHGSDSLQHMHDTSIQARTKLRLEADTEQQTQKLEDMKLSAQANRAAEKQRMEREEVEHRLRVKEMQHQKLLEQKQREVEHELAAIAKKNELAEQHLAALHAKGVDLTEVLVAKEQNNAHTKLIRFQGDAKAGGSNAIHNGTCEFDAPPPPTKLISELAADGGVPA